MSRFKKRKVFKIVNGGTFWAFWKSSLLQNNFKNEGGTRWRPGLAFFGLNRDKIHNHDYIDYNHGLSIIIRLNQKHRKMVKNLNFDQINSEFPHTKKTRFAAFSVLRRFLSFEWTHLKVLNKRSKEAVDCEHNKIDLQMFTFSNLIGLKC